MVENLEVDAGLTYIDNEPLGSRLRAVPNGVVSGSTLRSEPSGSCRSRRSSPASTSRVLDHLQDVIRGARQDGEQSHVGMHLAQ